MHQEILQSHFAVCLRFCELQYISTDWLGSISYTLTEYNILILTNGQAVAICCIKQILIVNQTKYTVNIYSALSLKIDINLLYTLNIPISLTQPTQLF